MDTEMEKLFGYAAIQSAPMYSLEECVAAEEQHRQIHAPDGAEGSAEYFEEIKERFRTALYLCDERERDFLSLAVESTVNKLAWTENMTYYPFRIFSNNDFIYLFLWEEQYYLVLPDELMTIYNEVMADADFAAVNARNVEMADYAAALLNLYGMYEIKWFAAVWNQHHKEKISEEEAEQFLSDQANFNADYFTDVGFVLNEFMDDDELEELQEAIERLDYYMPTKSVIRTYVQRGYDNSKISGEQEMDDFLAGFINDEQLLEIVQIGITISCERMEDPAFIRDLLEDVAAPLHDDTFVERFERLYNNLRYNTHVWPLRGFTPLQYQIETGNTILPFKLPKRKKTKK